MLISYGLPKLLSSSSGSDDGDLDQHWIYMNHDQYIMIAVSQSSISVWSSGQHRIRLACVKRTEADFDSFGVNVSAYWCPIVGSLAVLTSRHTVQIYTISILPHEPLMTGPSSLAREAFTVTCTLSSSHPLLTEIEPTATFITGQGDLLLLGCADGSLATLSWTRLSPPGGKGGIYGGVGVLFRELCNVLSSPLPLRHQHHSFKSNSYIGSRVSRVSGTDRDLPPPPPPPATLLSKVHFPPIVDMHYCDRSRSLVLVLADGSCAICTMRESGSLSGLGGYQTPLSIPEGSAEGLPSLPPSSSHLSSLSSIHLSHWLIRPPNSPISSRPSSSQQADRYSYTSGGGGSIKGQATRHAMCARVGWLSQLVAVGCSNGEVALFRLHKPSVGGGGGERGEPVRVLSQEPWGHTGSQTGGVAKLEWSPDGKNVAVGYQAQGVSVWTGSGCRLMSSLRQPRGGGGIGGGGGGIGGRPSSSGEVSPHLQLYRPGSQEVGGQGGQIDRARSAGSSGGAAGGGGSGGRVSGPLESPVTYLSWSNQGYQLMVAEAGHGSLVELQFARSLSRTHHRVSGSVDPGTIKSHGPAPPPPSTREELHVMQGHDRLLLISEPSSSLPPPSSLSHHHHQGPHSHQGGSNIEQQGSSGGGGGGNDLHVSHVAVPFSYLGPNWPLIHTSVNPNGIDMVVAGTRGLACYSRSTGKWRLFGNISQEREVTCQALCWVHKSVIVCCSTLPTKGGTPGSSSALTHHSRPPLPLPPSSSSSSSSALGGGGEKCELLFFPKYHLDQASLLCRHTLPQVPTAMDSVNSFLILASEPLEIALFEIEIEGKLSPSGTPKARLQLVREISMMDLGSPLLELALVAPSFHHPRHSFHHHRGLSSFPSYSSSTASISSPRVGSGGLLAPELSPPPKQCVLLRQGGLMSVLDLGNGSETPLASDIECFWISSDNASPNPNSSSDSYPYPNQNAFNDSLSMQAQPSSSSTTTLHSLTSPLPSDRMSPPSIDQTGVNNERGEGEDEEDEEEALEFGLGVADPLAQASGSAGLLSTRPTSAFSIASYPSLYPEPWSHPPFHHHLGSSKYSDPRQGGGAVEERGREGRGVEMPWWAYGPQGMQLWFPSSLSTPLVTPWGAHRTSRTATTSTIPPPSSSSSFKDVREGGRDKGGSPVWGASMDMELEFDQEVYPIGISLADASIVGMTQRLSRSPLPSSPAPSSSGYALPLLHPVPESQPVLPCLLRRLLQKGAFDEAVSLARCHESGPHFMRSLEWLLFTTLELEDTHKQDTSGSLTIGCTSGSLTIGCTASLLLSSAAQLVKRFPSFHADVVVSVARKTDATLWPPLFAAVGPPSDLLESLLSSGALGSAACFLLVIDRLQGIEVAHEQSVRLVALALDQGEYGLVADLLRFVMPPAELGAFLADQQQYGEGGERREGGAGTSDDDGAHKGAQGELQEASERSSSSPPAAAVAVAAPPRATVSWFEWIMGGNNKSIDSPKPQSPPPPSSSLIPTQQPPATSPSPAIPLGSRSAMDARRLVADHAWRLIESGEMNAWLRIHDAIRSLPGGLQLIMEEADLNISFNSSISLVQAASGARRKLVEDGEDDRAVAEDGGDVREKEEMEVGVMLSAISRMASEFQLWSDDEGWDDGVEAQAREARVKIRALLTSRHLHDQRRDSDERFTSTLHQWEFGISVVLADGPEIEAFKWSYPRMWQRMIERVQEGPDEDQYLASVLTLADEVASQ